ncbi:MAG: hypothetical protein K1X95_06070 [Acidimicrobiia bacterium]|nr:hypothetical protein [Acidimicrobiia bacterium]
MDTEPEASPPPGRPRERRYPLSITVRAMVLVAVAACTVLGYMIASAVGTVACSNTGCSARTPVMWGLLGAVIGLVGTAVVGVLLARSYGEWRMLRGLGATDSASTEVEADGTTSRPQKTC